MDVLIFFKGVFLLYMNLQGYLWWNDHKATKRFTVTLKLMFIVSCGVVSVSNRSNLCRLFQNFSTASPTRS